MKKSILAFLYSLAVGMVSARMFLVALVVYSVVMTTACPGISKQTINNNVDEAVKQVYFARGRVNEANKAVLELYKVRVISLELKDDIANASLAVYDGIEFANEQIKVILLDMENNIITARSAYEQIKQIVKDEVLIKINRFLVKFNLISQAQSDKWLPIVKVIRDIALQIVDVLNIKNTTVPAVAGVK